MTQLDELIARRDHHANEVEYLDRFIADFQKMETPQRKVTKTGKHKRTIKLENQARQLSRQGLTNAEIGKELNRSLASIHGYLKGMRQVQPSRLDRVMGMNPQLVLDELKI